MEEITNKEVMSENGDELLNMVLAGVKENNSFTMDMDLLNTIKIFDDNDFEDFEPVVKEKKMAKRVDISSLNINNKNALEKERDLKMALFGNKAAFQIVAAQSGYNAKVAPLVNKDVYNIINSNLNRYEYRKAVYECLWSKIIDTSIGKVSFEDWLKITSVEDCETIYYAVYCATFQNQKNFTFTCPYCQSEAEYTIAHNNLIKTADKEEMQKLISEINMNSNSREKMNEYTLVGKAKNEAFELSESGIVVDIRTPTLWDSLELLRTVSEEVISRSANVVTNLLYVDKMYIPSENGATYSEQDARNNILKIIENLSITDNAELENAINERLETHRITYSIKNIKCQHCSKEIRDIPINIEDVLFTAIFEKMN